MKGLNNVIIQVIGELKTSGVGMPYVQKNVLTY